MLTICIRMLIGILGAVSAQVFHQMVPLKEMRHLVALQQPHLPQDHNVLAATQQFLHRFAQLKALADQAPDDPPRKPTNIVAVHHQPQQHQPQQQVFIQHHFQPQPQQTHRVQNVAHIMVPIVNGHGIVVNPNLYPGPLAHQLPANVHLVG